MSKVSSTYNEELSKFCREAFTYYVTKLPYLLYGLFVVKLRVVSDLCTNLYNQQDEPSGKAADLFEGGDDWLSSQSNNSLGLCHLSVSPYI
jgi:hypothetical protein